MKPVRSSPQRLSVRIWRGVTLQLFLVAVLPLTVLVLLVTFSSLQLHHEVMRSLVADRNLRAVQAASASLTKEIAHRGNTLELLARELSGYASLEEGLAKVESDLGIYEGGVAAYKEGVPVVFMGSSLIEQYLETREVSQTRITPETTTYLPIQSIEGRLFVPVEVIDQDGVTLIGLFDPQQIIMDGLSALASEENVTAVVVDQENRVLFSSGRLSPEENIATHPGIQSALAGKSEINYLPTEEGEHVITTSTIYPVGWALMIEESWEDIASPLLKTTQNAPLIVVPILGLSMLALWFGLRQIVQPMQALEGKANDLARGNFETIRQPVGGVPEVRHLQETLAEMAVQLKEAQNSLHSYIGAITDSVESERRSLARELHDETLQLLIALGQYTQYALHWNKDEKVEKTLNQMTELVEQGTKNLRGLVRGLRPIYIEDLGLATALSMQAANQDRAGVQVHFHLMGEERRLNPDTELALYRMAQEALSNIARHSGARNAWVSLFFSQESVVLEIRDDGNGFVVPDDPLVYARQGHYGLLSLHERAEIMGAKLSISSAEGEGTLIRVRLPALQ